FRKTKDPGLRSTIIYALTRTGADGSQVIPLAEEALRDDNPSLARAALEALAKLDPKNKEILPGLVRTLGKEGNHYQSYRYRGQYVVNLLGATAADGLADLLKSPDAELRLGAACALSALGRSASKAADPLREALKDANGEVRLAAAEALWQATGQGRDSL